MRESIDRDTTDIYTEEEIKRLLKTRWMGQNLSFLEEVDSTNNHLRRLAAEGAPEGTLAVAVCQTAGKGRLGRRWDSPSGNGVWMSFLLRPSFPPERASMLTLVAALAVAAGIREVTGNRDTTENQEVTENRDATENQKIKGNRDAIEHQKETGNQNTTGNEDTTGNRQATKQRTGRQTEPDAGLNPQIKWPNDLVLDGKKVCGILTEMSTGDEGIRFVIVGIGINVNFREFPEEIRETATSLELCTGATVPRAPLVAAVARAWEDYYERFLRTLDLSLLVEEYNRLLVNRDREVRVLAPAGDYTGIARGINPEGELLVETGEKEIRAVVSGEVSVRGIYGYV